MPLFKLFMQFYEERIELFLLKASTTTYQGVGQKNDVFFLLRTKPVKRTKSGSVPQESLTETELEAYVKRKKGISTINPSAQVAAKHCFHEYLKTMPKTLEEVQLYRDEYYFDFCELLLKNLSNNDLHLSVLIYPGQDWESVQNNGTNNYSGLFAENNKHKLVPLVTPHWVNEHVFIPSQEYLETLNWLSRTPFLLNEAAFNYSYNCPANPEYINENTFTDIYTEFIKLLNLRTKLSAAAAADSDNDIAELQTKLSKYYSQSLYRTAITNALTRYSDAANKTYTEISSLLEDYHVNTTAESLFTTSGCFFFFPLGPDFRKRLTSKYSVHYLNDNNFRHCFNSAYYGLQTPTTISRLSSELSIPPTSFDSACMASKKPIKTYSLKETLLQPKLYNNEFICMDAVSSGIQHEQLLLNCGPFADELYFSETSTQTLYQRLNANLTKNYY